MIGTPMIRSLWRRARRAALPAAAPRWSRHAAGVPARVSALTLVAALIAGAVGSPRALSAQSGAVVPGGDFDICDGHGGTLRGKTAFLRGRPGFGTEREIFAIVNAATPDQDCGGDGYTASTSST